MTKQPLTAIYSYSQMAFKLDHLVDIGEKQIAL